MSYEMVVPLFISIRVPSRRTVEALLPFGTSIDETRFCFLSCPECRIANAAIPGINTSNMATIFSRLRRLSLLFILCMMRLNMAILVLGYKKESLPASAAFSDIRSHRLSSELLVTIFFRSSNSVSVSLPSIYFSNISFCASDITGSFCYM